MAEEKLLEQLQLAAQFAKAQAREIIALREQIDVLRKQIDVLTNKAAQ